jgi:hypothetical protein
MTNHVLTPFSRFFNLIELGNRIKEEGAQWHLLLDKGVHLPDLGQWLECHNFEKPPPNFFVGHWMINQFLDHVGVVDEDRYMVLTDDDYLPPGFFAQLNAYQEDVLIVAMQRSNKPSVEHRTDRLGTLLPSPDHIKIGHVGFEQMIIRGRLLREFRCGGDYCADGDLIMRIFARYPECFRFVPEVRVYFDYLPPGRYKFGSWVR